MTNRIIKNLTGSDEMIADLGVTVPSESSIDLCDSCQLEEIANSDDLIELLGQGVSNFVINDGVRDYTIGEGIDLVRRIVQKFPTDTVSQTPRFSVIPPEGNEVIIISHNWCDKCTWYTNSTRIAEEEAEVLSDSGDGLTFNSQHEFWIDLNHGRLSKEEYIKTAYLPIIKVNGVTVTERTPFSDEGGDFVIDYESGSVTFSSSQSGKTVTAIYSYASDSVFSVVPSGSEILRVERAEVQFSKNIEMNDSVAFQIWAYNPLDLPNKVQVQDSDVFKTVRDFVDDATGCYPEIPAFGGTKRGLSYPHIVLPFNYRTVRDLKGSDGLEIRIKLENDIPFGGEFATITFYCTSM